MLLNTSVKVMLLLSVLNERVALAVAEVDVGGSCEAPAHEHSSLDQLGRYSYVKGV